MGTDIFISYASEDAGDARRLYDDLKSAGFNPWLDRENLLPGQNWRDAITKAIRECNFFLCLISSRSLTKRGYVQKEMKMALDVLDEFPDGEIFFIPVRLDDCKPINLKLTDIHHVDLFPSYEEGFKKILAAIGSKADIDPAQKIEPVNLLHLSDLHFGTQEDANRWYGQLKDDLKINLECPRLDALIISGDVAKISAPEEYDAAKKFLELVCGQFDVGPGQVVIVPGNHDLSWEISETESYQLAFKKHYKGKLIDGHFIKISDEVIQFRDEEKYKSRFKYFAEFYQSVTGKTYPLEYSHQGMIHHLPDQNILIVGFNSAWESDHHFRSRVSICPDAVSHALDSIWEDRFDDCLKMAVWHHPLVSNGEDRIKDHGFMQRLAVKGFTACLHGHIHKADAGLFRYDMTPDGRRIHIIGAGTFGAPVKEWTPGYPLQYNLLRLKGNALRVETRRRIELNGAWEPDHMWRHGKQNLPFYDIDLRGEPKARPAPQEDIKSKPEPLQTPPTLPKPSIEDAIKAYRGKAEGLHEKLPVMGFKTHLRVPIKIEDIYVPLRAMVDFRATGKACFADAEDAEKCLREHGGEEITVPDAFHITEKMNRRGIVILGDPGSGKTTHMKRVLLWCLKGGLGKLGLPDDMLPVFLPLRELKNLKQGLENFIQEQLDQPHLGTPEGFGEELLERGNLLLLFDGLDEVADPKQRKEVCKWIDDAIRIHKSCRFVVTCRFAGYTDESRLSEDFLEMHMRPLSTEQAETFIQNWGVQKA
jgi:hypothetical protein